MTINLISDIHCLNKTLPEHFYFEKLKNADVLVIAGDIGTFVNRNKIIKLIENKYIGKDKKFKHLVYCWGNHDYYVTDRWWMKNHSDLYCGPQSSDNHVNIINGVAFICSPMWSYIENNDLIARGVNDYVYIRGLTTKKSTELFETNAKWILDMVELYKGQGLKTVVVTHHLPHPETISLEYRHGDNSLLNEAFCVMKREYFNKFAECGCDLWLHGHSHQFNCTYIKSDNYNYHGTSVKCIRNPFGYDWCVCQEWPYTNFKYDYIIEI